MSVLETLVSTGSDAVVKQLAGQFGLTSEQASSSVTSLLPALAAGMKEKLASGDSSLLSQLTSGSLTKFADTPSNLASPAAIEQGKSLLSGIFGSQDLTHLVSAVAEKSGIGGDIITRILPVAATLLGGILSKSSAAGGNITDIVGEVASAGHSGVVETVKGLVAKIFG